MALPRVGAIVAAGVDGVRTILRSTVGRRGLPEYTQMITLRNIWTRHRLAEPLGSDAPVICFENGLV